MVAPNQRQRQRQRQRIDVTGLPAETLHAHRDIVSAVILFLDGTLALTAALEYVSPPHLMPEPREWDLVRHAALLWASAHGLRRVDDHGEHRAMRLVNDRGYLFMLHVPDGCEFDPHPKPAAAPRVTVNDDAMWSPASGVAP